MKYKKETYLKRLSNSPVTISITGIKNALIRLQEFRTLQDEKLDVSRILSKRL
nr:hypothetical protein [Bacillus cereus]